MKKKIVYDFKGICMKKVNYPGGLNWVEGCPVGKVFLIFINHLTVVNVNDCTRPDIDGNQKLKRYI